MKKITAKLDETKSTQSKNKDRQILIVAQDLIDAMEFERKNIVSGYGKVFRDGYDYAFNTVEALIFDAQVAETQSVGSGTWTEEINAYTGGEMFRCSSCNKCSVLSYRYCPECGTKMADKE